MPISKNDQFYGYVAVWEGYPFYQDQVLPSHSGSCTILGDHVTGSTLINIDPAKTVLPVATGDTIILDNIAYLILHYSASQLLIEPGLTRGCTGGTIGSVIHSTIAPTTFQLAHNYDPIVALDAYNDVAYDVGATAIHVVVSTGVPTAGQYLIIGSQRLLIDSYGSGTIHLHTGLEFPILIGTHITQTRNQLIEITNRDGDIFLNDPVRLNDNTYHVLSYQETPEAVILTDPGLIESLPEHTVGTIYH